MSTLQIEACDGCGKETRDHFAEAGWLEIRSCQALALSLGRDAREQAVVRSKPAGSYLYCSPKCLVDSLGPAPVSGVSHP